MKVTGMTDEQVQAEMKKVIRVRAKGEPDVYVGYYNHLRRRGGDVFIIRPIIRTREVEKVRDGKVVMDSDPRLKVPRPLKEKKVVLITAEQQFSERWMERVNKPLPETAPKHFNVVGRGAAKNKLNIPGMTRKVGGDNDAHVDDNFDSNMGGGEQSSDNEPQTEENVI